jgi:small-conductance mechanosensitive channel
MQQLAQHIQTMASEFGALELRVVETIVVLLVLMLVRQAVYRLVMRRVTDARARYHWGKGISYATAFIGLFVIGRIWFVGFRSIATFLGLVAAGLVISLKEPVSNMAGWFYLLWRRPFVLGDRIQIGEHSGDVIDRRLFQFTILEIGNWIDADQSTGRIIHVPNGRLFHDPVANYTRGFAYLWNEVTMTVTFESDWREAKRLLLEVGERHRLGADVEAQILAEGAQYMIFYSTLAPAVFTRGVPHGVELSLRYVCGARQRRGSAQQIWEDVLDALAASDRIDFAYPTQRFYNRAVEREAPRQDGAAGRGADESSGGPVMRTCGRFRSSRCCWQAASCRRSPSRCPKTLLWPRSSCRRATRCRGHGCTAPSARRTPSASRTRWCRCGTRSAALSWTSMLTPTRCA